MPDSYEESEGSRDRPIRQAVIAETGRELLKKLNIKSDKREEWKRKGNKRNMSNRDIFSEIPDSKKAIASDVDPDSTRRPGVIPKMWTEEEDELLRQAVKKHGERNWKTIANLVPGRSYIQCLQRWKKALKPGLVKGHWSKEEDDKLLELVEQYRPNWDWGIISKQIPGRNAKQCRERWFLNLDPTINRGPWTREEDELLLKFVAQWGGRWALIAKHIPGRTENAVKTRFHSIQRKEARNREWTKEEDKIIIDLVLQHGRDFERISTHLDGRTKGQIKKRFSKLAQDMPHVMQRAIVIENALREQGHSGYDSPRSFDTSQDEEDVREPPKPALYHKGSSSWKNQIGDLIQDVNEASPAFARTNSAKIIAGILNPEMNNYGNGMPPPQNRQGQNWPESSWPSAPSSTNFDAQNPANVQNTMNRVHTLLEDSQTDGDIFDQYDFGGGQMTRQNSLANYPLYPMLRQNSSNLENFPLDLQPSLDSKGGAPGRPAPLRRQGSSFGDLARFDSSDIKQMFNYL